MASNYLTKPEFDEGEKVLQAQVKEISLTPAQPIEEWAMAPRMLQSFFTVNSNIWTVIPAGTKSRLPIKPVAPVRTCSTSDMIDLYMKAGYLVKDGGKGSHLKLKKPGAPTMILPGNRSELSPRVTKNALSVLGNFSIRDLQSLLKR
jgi:predicted RNA binding protein YcfA (HicA-like mRNA interferase family)